MPPAPPPETADITTVLVARQLDMALPAECVAGVASNLAVLAAHWASLRAFALPDDAA